MPRRKLARPTYRLNLRRGRYFIDYTDPDTGRTRSVSTGTAERRAAEVWRDQWLAGRDQPSPPSEPRIEDILRGYQAAREGKVQAPATILFSMKALSRHVGNLAPRMLAQTTYMDRRARDGVRDGTIRRELAVLRAALNWAVREKWIERAPHIAAPGSGPPRDRWLTRGEIERLIEAAELKHLKLFVVLAYHTAARAGAIFDLTWDRVDLDHRRISYDRPGRQASKKRRAVVPINPPAMAELQSAREVATIEHVIEWRGKPVRSVKRAFKDACSRAGIEECSPHTLRHTAATHMVMQGVPLREVARFLGDTEAMVEKVYGKHSPDYLRRAADALAGPIGPRETVATATETTLRNGAKPRQT